MLLVCCPQRRSHIYNGPLTYSSHLSKSIIVEGAHRIIITDVDSWSSLANSISQQSGLKCDLSFSPHYRRIENREYSNEWRPSNNALMVPTHVFEDQGVQIGKTLEGPRYLGLTPSTWFQQVFKPTSTVYLHLSWLIQCLSSLFRIEKRRRKRNMGKHMYTS